MQRTYYFAWRSDTRVRSTWPVLRLVRQTYSPAVLSMKILFEETGARTVHKILQGPHMRCLLGYQKEADLKVLCDVPRL